MLIRSIKLIRDGDYETFGTFDPGKPLIATIIVSDTSSEAKLVLSAEASAKLLEVIKDELVASSRRIADLMTASIIEGNTLLLASQKPSIDDDIPF